MSDRFRWYKNMNTGETHVCVLTYSGHLMTTYDQFACGRRTRTEHDMVKRRNPGAKACPECLLFVMESLLAA